MPPLTAVEVVVPVYNEEAGLEACVRRLRTFLDEHFPFPALVTVADNASTDHTWSVARRLAADLDGVHAVHIDEKGRGRALRAVWSASQAEVVAYTDADLASGLDALLPLVAPLLSGHSDVAIGSRLLPGSRVVRGPKRELISRTYNGLIHVGLGSQFSDAQCGFKALRAEVARALLPLVVDNGWFFDTELLVLAERNGLRVAEVPVDWIDDPNSSVHVTRTAIEDLRGLVRMRRALTQGHGAADLPRPEDTDPLSPVARTSRLGAVPTAAYLAGFLAARRSLGAYGASDTALTAGTALNVALHWQLADKDRRPASVLRLDGTGLLLDLAGTTMALAVASLIGRRAATDQIIAMLVGLGAAAVARSLLERAPDRPIGASPPPTPIAERSEVRR